MRRLNMRYLRYIALLGVLLIPASYARAQVSLGFSYGGPVYQGGYDDDGGNYQQPDCTYGYYNYYPYTCAPYGYYGSQWFNNGLFLGIGPWYGWGWGGGWYRGGYGRGGYGRGGYGRGGYGRGGYGRGGY